MKLTKREKILVVVLLEFVLISAFLFYIKPKYEATIEEKEQSKTELNQKLFAITAEARKIDERKEKLESIKKDISEKSKTFFSYEYKDRDYLKLINAFVKDSELVTKEIEFERNDIKVVIEDDKGKPKKGNPKKEKAKKGTAVKKNPKNDKKVSTPPKEKPVILAPNVKATKVKVDIRGKYDNLKKFIDFVNKYEKKIVFDEFEMTTQFEGGKTVRIKDKDETGNKEYELVDGVFVLAFYSIDSAGKYSTKSEEGFTKNPPAKVKWQEKDYSPFEPIKK